MKWYDCGTMCTDHCDKGMIMCKAICTQGCFCTDGYARIKDKCQPEDLCVHNCPDNEHFEKCGNKCTEACSIPLLACDATCARGCFCDAGYKRRLDNTCAKCECNDEGEIAECEGIVTSTEAAA